jgi:hypothetical protein
MTLLAMRGELQDSLPSDGNAVAGLEDMFTIRTDRNLASMRINLMRGGSDGAVSDDMVQAFEVLGIAKAVAARFHARHGTPTQPGPSSPARFRPPPTSGSPTATPVQVRALWGNAMTVLTLLMPPPLLRAPASRYDISKALVAAGAKDTFFMNGTTVCH